MIFLSAFSMFAMLVYCLIGIYAYRQNPSSIIHKVFLCLCISYAIWSFGYSFVYLLEEEQAISFWNKFAAIGWCSFSAISLYLVLLITDHPLVKKNYVKMLIFTPAVVFFYMAVFLFGPDIHTSQLISSIFYIGDFIYNFTYLLASIVILLLWGLKSKSTRVRKQAGILVISSIIPFLLNLMTQTVLPVLNIVTPPNMGQLYSVIMILGACLVISRYKFLKMPERFIYEEIMREMLDMTILINEVGQIIKVNKNTLVMLGYEKSEVIGKSVDTLIPSTHLVDLLQEDGPRNISLSDQVLLARHGKAIPIHVTSTLIFDRNVHDLLGAILVIQDLRLINELKQKNRELHEKAIRDSLTDLYNHQYSIELLKKEVLRSVKSGHALSVMMLDIDNFKRINDTFGHQFGDSVLVSLSKIFINCIGDSGHVGRYGGEEFIIILPNAPAIETVKISEHIRKEVKNWFSNQCSITVSIGITQRNDEDATKLIRNADQLLYLAKDNGRDRIESDAQEGGSFSCS